jgi:AraC family transcriptional regulator of arabinose operon
MAGFPVYMEYCPAVKSRYNKIVFPVDKRIYGYEFEETSHYHTIREKGRPDCLLIYTLAGIGRVGFQKMETNLEPGNLCLYEPASFQDYRTAAVPGHWHFLWVHFDASARLSSLIDWPLWKKGIRLLNIPMGALRMEIEEAMQRMIRHSGRPGANADALAYHSLEEVLLLVQPTAAGGGGRDLRIQRAIDHLTLHYEQKFELGSLAKLAGLSISRLSHLFQEETGKSLRGFQEDVRMEHASSLLLFTQLPVAEVALKCGYEDALYFSKRFRRLKGFSPSGFRTRQGGL